MAGTSTATSAASSGGRGIIGKRLVEQSTLCGPCVALASDPWDTTDKVLFGASIVTAAADVITTRQAIDNGGMEVNPIYGDNPSTGRLVAVKGAFLVVRYLVADQLTGWWRKAFIGSSIMFEAYASHNNLQVAGEVRW